MEYFQFLLNQKKIYSWFFFNFLFKRLREHIFLLTDSNPIDLVFIENENQANSIDIDNNQKKLREDKDVPNSD